MNTDERGSKSAMTGFLSICIYLRSSVAAFDFIQDKP